MLNLLRGLLWDDILLYVIPLVGIFISLRTGWVQVTQFKRGFCSIRKKAPLGEGSISPYGALCTALSATMGTGNIVGVATAVCLGGPGALLWMEVAAFLGMAVKYAEGTLAVIYRRRGTDGGYHGGPFCYIEDGLGKPWRPLAKAFALFGLVAGTAGIGTLTQVNSIATAAQAAVGCQAGTLSFAVTNLVVAALSVAAVAAVVGGGVGRIAKVSEYLIPLVTAVYMILTVWVLWRFRSQIPYALTQIWRGAFDPASAVGGGAGITVKTAMRVGMGRGIFSNEAGLGSSAIADAAAQTDQPTRQGLVSMLTVFIDTMVVCTLTGLAVVVTRSHLVDGLSGAQITAYALGQGLPLSPQGVAWMLAVCLAIFAVTSMLGWFYYAHQCLRYLCSRPKVVSWFRWIYLIPIGVGPFLSAPAVWDLADLCNGLMALPNLLALLALSGVVAGQTKRMIWQERFQRDIKKCFAHLGKSRGR